MSTATLNGHRATRARVDIRKWGCWYADATIDGEVTLSGAATLKIADLTLQGTILSGGPMKGRSTFTVVAGAGAWGRTIPSKNYADDGSTKASKVLVDAATSVGETMADVASTVRVGAGFTRPEGPASQVLQLVAPQAWYVDEAGVTRLGARAAGALVGKVTRVAPADLATGKVVLAAESIATILPGVVVDGMSAVDVRHEISADGGLRSTVWGAQQPSELESMRALIEQLFPELPFKGLTEYRVVTLEGNRLNLQPVRASSGMPDLRRVPVRPGVAGCSAEAALGALVLVGFVDSDRARPFVSHFEDEDGSGFVPTVLKFAGGDDFVALASSVATQLSNISTALTTHVHAGVTAGPAVTGVAAPVYTPGSVAASKVKAT